MTDYLAYFRRHDGAPVPAVLRNRREGDPFLTEHEKKKGLAAPPARIRGDYENMSISALEVLYPPPKTEEKT